MDSRQEVLENWIRTARSQPPQSMVAMPGDASFRRYFRVQYADGSFVAMDAPPERGNNSLPFVAIAKALKAKKLLTPDVIASDVLRGFLLLSDLGDHVFLKTVNSTNADELYTRALQALSVMQSCRHVQDWAIPPFTAEFMVQELQLFKEWFLLQHLGLTLSTQTENMLTDFFQFLADSAASQPQVFMHRDYHSANLMVLPNSKVGILDFQDAFIGPVTYDLVSLLRDCYIDWPTETVKTWALQYKAMLPDLQNVRNEDFIRWFDLMGLQRHMKAILTFSRKFHRDHTAAYLQHIPRTLHYIAAISPLYPECQAFNNFLNEIILSSYQKVLTSCAQ